MEGMPPYPGHYDRSREFMASQPDYQSQAAAAASRSRGIQEKRSVSQLLLLESI